MDPDSIFGLNVTIYDTYTKHGLSLIKNLHMSYPRKSVDYGEFLFIRNYNSL